MYTIFFAAAVPSVLLFLLLRPRCPPHWCLQIVLVPSAFVMSIIWLNIMANEVVSVMRAFGLLLSIDTGAPLAGPWNPSFPLGVCPSNHVSTHVYQ